MASKVAVPFFVPTRMNESSCCFYILVSIWSCQFWIVAGRSNRCGSGISLFTLWIQFISVAQSCPTLCDPMNLSTPGLPVHHQLPEFTQTHVHQVSDANQPSHPLLSAFPPALIFPSIRVFSSESVLHTKWLKYWSFSFSISPSNEYSGLISFRIDWFDRLLLYYYYF